VFERLSQQMGEMELAQETSSVRRLCQKIEKPGSRLKTKETFSFMGKKIFKTT
jgi:hypothetical protein